MPNRHKTQKAAQAKKAIYMGTGDSRWADVRCRLVAATMEYTVDPTDCNAHTVARLMQEDIAFASDDSAVWLEPYRDDITIGEIEAAVHTMTELAATIMEGVDEDPLWMLNRHLRFYATSLLARVKQRYGDAVHFFGLPPMGGAPPR